MAEAHGDLLGAQRRWIDERRGPLMFMAIMAATVAGWAGMHPPGGFYRTDPNAGEPVLRVKFPDRYEYFSASHWMAFWYSLILFLVLLLSNDFFYRTPERMTVLVIVAFLDLVFLVSTFACYHYLACLVSTLG